MVATPTVHPSLETRAQRGRRDRALRPTGEKWGSAFFSKLGTFYGESRDYRRGAQCAPPEAETFERFRCIQVTTHVRFRKKL